MKLVLGIGFLRKCVQVAKKELNGSMRKKAKNKKIQKRPTGRPPKDRVGETYGFLKVLKLADRAPGEPVQ